MAKISGGRGIEIDIPTLFSETQKALFWPGNLFARRAFAKTRSGDFAEPGRMYTKVAQVQTFVVITQAVLSLAAAVVIVRGLAA
ncbi:hypothetical protein I5U65_03400 [Stenotrophomonas maltophilia]|nr:hypothetical protein [Stenotrophomonas maltophilia]